MNSHEPKTDSKKQRKFPSLAGWFILSWIVTFIGGVIFCFAMLWLTSFMVGDYGEETSTQDMARLLIVYGLTVCVVLWLTIRSLSRRTHPYFRFTKIALRLGLGLNILVIIGGMIMAIVVAIQHDVDTSSGVSDCQELDLSKSNLISATVPIMTDKNMTGTAFAIDEKGHYLTAYHVIEGAKSVYINSTDGKSPLKVIKADAGLDIALLRGKKSSYPLKLTSRYEQADQVYALGYPENAFFAGYASLSHGIVSRLISNKDLKMMSSDAPSGLSIVQTDAAINPGNSGGPLLNKCGVVGVVTSISSVYGASDYGLESEQGISYAVSAQTIARRFDLAIQR